MTYYQKKVVSTAFQWTWTETKKLVGFLLPLVAAGVVTYATQRTEELQAGGQLVQAAALAGVLKIVQLYVSNNGK